MIYHQRKHYIVDVFRGRLVVGDLLRKIAYLCDRYEVERLLVEDAASGMQIIQLLRENLPARVPWPIACKREGDKKTRFSAQASRIQAGEVLLPRVAGWKGEFLKEITGFPNSRYDDQADALAELLAIRPLGNEPVPIAGPITYHDGVFDSEEGIELLAPSPWDKDNAITGWE